MEIYTLCFFLLLFLITLKIGHQITEKPSHRNLPPTPPALPIIGHLHHLTKAPLHRILHRLTQAHGRGGDILLLWFGTRRVVVVSSPSAVEECFTKNDIVLANRPPLLVGKHVGYNYTSMVASPYGKHWRNLRRIGAIEILSSSRLNAFLGLRRDEVKRLLLRIHRRSSADPYSKVELKSVFPDLTFNVIMRMIAGKRYFGDDVEDEGEARQFRRLINEIFENAGAGNPADFLPILNWIPDSYEKRIERVAKRTDKFMQSLIDERRSCKSNVQNTMIDHLLSLQESQPEYYTDHIIKGFILVLILAATDTSAVTLEWAMSNLLNHPDILKRARDEIDTQIGQQNLVEESEISKLPYLQNIISETLRLCPSAPMLVPHYSSNDCTVSGYDVPKDTILLVNAWAIHRDPKVWDDAESFNPERFESGDSAELTNNYKLIPFGVGRRSCPGVGLAQRVVGATLASLIQCFEWERVSEQKVDMSEGKGLTMPKLVPLEAICRSRPIMETLAL